MKTTRDHSIDALRGLAIFTMIAANMAAKNYAEPHPFIFRLYGSFAAPAFIFLSGLMVSYCTFSRNYNFLYFLKRGAAILLTAALIDIFLWDLFPFVSFDVLYVIGLSLPVAFLLTRVKLWIHCVIAIVILASTPAIQNHFGYSEYPSEILLAEGKIGEKLSAAPLMKHFLSEGWFPLFPWMGISLLGTFFGRLRSKAPEKINLQSLAAGGILVAAGIPAWIIQSPNLMTREGYSELFYPPTLPYLAVFTGLILVTLSLFERLKNPVLLFVFTIFGRSSLLMYILHTFFIAFFFNKNFSPLPFSGFLQLYLLHAFFLWWIALLVQLPKEQVKKLPYFLRFIIGG